MSLDKLNKTNRNDGQSNSAVSDLDTHQLLHLILHELKMISFHLQIITEEETDIGDALDE